jgi:hypothetical protein
VIKVLPRWAEIDHEEAMVVDTTSRGGDKALSPFFLGPVRLYGKHCAMNVENGWQFSKVYKEHTDACGNPTEEYWQWAEDGWAERFAYRYPMGKGRKPEYTYWDGEHLSYIEARKRVYAPLYAGAVTQTGAYKRLLAATQAGRDIVLLDFDAYDHRKFGMDYEDVVNCEQRKMGHAFVLAMLLEGDRAWEK